MTIEERANKAYPIYGEGYFDNDIKNACFHAYCKGAREQKAIDIDKACEWLEKNAVYFPEHLEAFRKAMDE